MTFKMDPAYAGAPGTCLISGKFTPPFAISGSNYQILPTLFSYTATPGTFNSGHYGQVQPTQGKVTVFCNPVAGVAPFNINISPLPRGLPPTVTPSLGTEFVVDLSGFPGEMMFAHAHVISNSRGARTVDALVSILDQSNMNLYIQTVSYATGALTSLPANATIAFQVGIKDSIGI